MLMKSVVIELNAAKLQLFEQKEIDRIRYILDCL